MGDGAPVVAMVLSCEADQSDLRLPAPSYLHVDAVYKSLDLFGSVDGKW